MAALMPLEAAYATAYSPWRFDAYVWVAPSQLTAFCDRAGILDTAINLSNVQTHTTSSCGSSGLNVPAGYLVVNDVPRVLWSRLAGISCDVDDSVDGFVFGRGEHS
jgi:hypothetical protein